MVIDELLLVEKDLYIKKHGNIEKFFDSLTYSARREGLRNPGTHRDIACWHGQRASSLCREQRRMSSHNFQEEYIRPCIS